MRKQKHNASREPDGGDRRDREREREKGWEPSDKDDRGRKVEEKRGSDDGRKRGEQTLA